MGFTDNLWSHQGSIKGTAKFYAPVDASKQMAMVAVADIGAASATILASPENHTSKVYNLTSCITTMNDVAAAFSTAVKRTVEYVHVPYDAATNAMVEMGVPKWMATGINDLYKLIDAGDSSQ